MMRTPGAVHPCGASGVPLAGMTGAVVATGVAGSCGTERLMPGTMLLDGVRQFALTSTSIELPTACAMS